MIAASGPTAQNGHTDGTSQRVEEDRIGALRRAATTLGVAALLVTTVLIASPANAVTSGEAWAVENNNYGQLGNGTTTGSSTPVKVRGLSGVRAIAAGATHSLALLSDGTVRAWGNNDYGQLGDGTVTTRLTPVKVLHLSSVIAIVAGAAHSLAVRSDGTVRGWGNNGHGQLGNGKTSVVQVTPVKALRLGGVKAVAGGWFHSLART
jgi:alpha-tubulin suppressor-like RCC1 family protein